MNDPSETVHEPSGGVVGLARRVAPHLHVVSASEAAPRSFNVVAFVTSSEAARDIVLEFESMSDDSAGVGESDLGTGTVVMGSQEVAQAGIDPEGVGRWLGPRILTGLVVGAVIGAAVGAGLAAVFDGPVLAAALAGAAMLSLFTAIWLTFAKLGGSEAYRETFVAPHTRELTVVSFHTDDEARADEAFGRLGGRADVSAAVFDASLSKVLRR